MSHPLRAGVLTGALAVLVLTLAPGEAPPEPPRGYFRLEARTLPADLYVVAPDPPAKGREHQLLLFFPGANEADPQYLETLVARRDALAPLAAELGAVFVFVTPRSGAPSPVALKSAVNDLLKKYEIDSDRIAAVGHGDGAEAAFRFFAGDARLASALVLVAPQMARDADEPRVASDPRACLIVAEQGRGEHAVTARKRVLARHATADVMVHALPELAAVPMAHAATFLRYAYAAAQLQREMTASTATPETGVGRVRRLTTLLEVRDLVRQAGPARPVALVNAAGPPVPEAGDFVNELRARFAALKPLMAETGERVNKALEDAKAQAQRRLDLLKKSRLTGKQRQAAFDRFAEENFPWPDLVADARAAAKDAPAADTGGKTAKVSEQEFMNVMRAKCVRCHRDCGSVDQMKRRGWLRPGKPESSKVYTVIGKHARAGATYHNLSDREKQIVHDYVEEAK